MEGRPASMVSRTGAGVFFAGVMLVALLMGRGLSQAWTMAPDLGHGWALPCLMGWLIWERISTAGKIHGVQTPRASGWLLLATGLVLYTCVRLLLEPFPLWPSVLWLLALLLYFFLLASAWLAGGKAWVRALAGPLALIFTAVPWPGVMENAFLHPLRQGLAVGVAEVLNLMSVPAFAEGATIQISGGIVGVDEACGGMRSLQTSLLIGWFVGELACMGLARRFALLGCAVIAAIAGNFLRALTLTWLMDEGGVELLNKWHDPAGYLALGCSLLVVLLLGWWWRAKDASATADPGAGWAISRRSVVWAAVALAGCVMIETGVRGWYGSRERQVQRMAAWAATWPRNEQQFRTYPLSERAREMLKPDDFSSASWRTPDDRDRSGYYIVWESGQQARNMPFLHGPEVCLPMTGIELIGRGDPVSVETGGIKLPFDSYEFRQHGRPMYVFRIVWNPDEGRAASPPRDLESLPAWMGQRWADVAARRVAVRAQVLTLAISGEKNREDALKAFHEEISRIIAPEVR